MSKFYNYDTRGASSASQIINLERMVEERDAEIERLRSALATVPSPPDLSDMEWAGKAALEDAQKENERLRGELQAIGAWAGATAALLDTVPRPSGPASRVLVDAIEGGKAWSYQIDAALAEYHKKVPA